MATVKIEGVNNMDDFKDYKITEEEKQKNLVKNVQGSKLKGTVEENKSVFDKMAVLICNKFNAFIDFIKEKIESNGADTKNLAKFVNSALSNKIESVNTKRGTDIVINPEDIAVEKYNDDILHFPSGEEPPNPPAGGHINLAYRLRKLYRQIKNLEDFRYNDLMPMLENKVDTVDGKGLSTNDFTNEHKTKLESINADSLGDISADSVRVRDGNTVETMFRQHSDRMQRVYKELDEKVDKVENMSLSTNDFTNEHKSVLEKAMQFLKEQSFLKATIPANGVYVFGEHAYEKRIINKSSYGVNFIIGDDMYFSPNEGMDKETKSNGVAFLNSFIYNPEGKFLTDLNNSFCFGHNNTFLPTATLVGTNNVAVITKAEPNRYVIKFNNIERRIREKDVMFFVTANKTGDGVIDMRYVLNRIDYGSLGYDVVDESSIIVYLPERDGADIGASFNNQDSVYMFSPPPHHNAVSSKRDLTVIGSNNVVSGSKNIVVGHFNQCITAQNNIFIGQHLSDNATALNKNIIVIGRYNNPSAYSDTIFAIGCGNKDNRRDVFGVGSEGNVYATGKYETQGADYAEYFEWIDGNPASEDRIGRFVTLDGDKIRIAGEKDNYIIGVISGTAGIVGDNYTDAWHDKYVMDKFGRVKYENVLVEAETDEDGNVIVEEYVELRPVISKDYNSNKKYIPRKDRQEWDIVGMFGKLFVVDNGKCAVNGYCSVGDGGIAVPSKTKTDYRVMKRVTDDVVQILFK